MARRLEEFPTIIDRGDGKYPWSEWTDGSPWELVQGEDFKIKVSSMRQTAAKLAERRGLNLKTATRNVDGKRTLVVQFTPKAAPKRSPTNGRRGGGAQTRAK